MLGFTAIIMLHGTSNAAKVVIKNNVEKIADNYGFFLAVCKLLKRFAKVSSDGKPQIKTTTTQ